jgi:C-terminal processing protease CtpA/Prc
LFYVHNEKRYPVDRNIAMLNLDTVGRLRANRLMVLESESAREWVHIFRGAGVMTGVETAMITETLDASDHTSFVRAGVPAVQLFTGPHQDYHRPSDTFERIGTEGLVKVAEVAKEVIEYLAKRKEPLTPGAGPESTKGHTGNTERKVSLGIIPDFTFIGQGCRLSDVVKLSPAEECGLREGDIIKSVNGQPVSSLKDLSDVLRSLNPGDKMEIVFLRDGREMKVLAEAGSK